MKEVEKVIGHFIILLSAIGGLILLFTGSFVLAEANSNKDMFIAVPMFGVGLILTVAALTIIPAQFGIVPP